MHKRATLFYAFRATLPVMAGYLVLGAGFGMLLQASGYAWWWALAMSLTIYAGSMQYVTIGLLTGGASLLSAALMTFMVNLRHVFYGITMLNPYRNTGKLKPYLIFSLTDETFSLVCAPQLPASVNTKQYYVLVSLFNQCYWVLGSVAGAWVGTAVSVPLAGLEFSMTALFVVIFIQQWEAEKRHGPALTGVAVSAVCLMLFGSSAFLVPSTLGITLVLLLQRKPRQEGGI